MRLQLDPQERSANAEPFGKLTRFKTMHVREKPRSQVKVSAALNKEAEQLDLYKFRETVRREKPVSGAAPKARVYTKAADVVAKPCAIDSTPKAEPVSVQKRAPSQPNKSKISVDVLRRALPLRSAQLKD